MDFGRILIIIGIVFVVIGILWTFASRIPWIGRLPGDIFVRRGNFTFYFPLMTGILISILVSLLLYFLRK